MNDPKSLRFAKSHEWVRLEGKKAFVGISDYAQKALGDIVFVESPSVGDEFAKGDEAATIESVKAASPIYTPISGKVIEVNGALEGEPERINKAAYDEFLFVLEPKDAAEVSALMDYAAYQKHLESEAH